MKKLSGLITLLLIIVLSERAFPQPGATKPEKNPFHKAYHDSLKAMDYKYRFPLLGKGAYKKGYDIQFPWGLGMAFFAQRQQVLISKTEITFNNSAPIDLSNAIEFGNIQNVSMATSFRPSLWILPFLNVYGLFAAGNSTTTVPLVKPINFTTEQKFVANTAGIGATFAGGIGNVIIIVDQNYNWVNLDAFVEPVPNYNLDARIGHNFVNPRRADRSVTIWFGAFFQQIKNDTKGSIKVSDLFPGLPQEKKDEIKTDLDQWYNSLGPLQQAGVNAMVNHIKDFMDGKNPGDGTIGYTLDKKLAGPWNLIFGAQYQHNKHWQVRSEVGTFGTRSQFLLNVNYSFLGFKKR